MAPHHNLPTTCWAFIHIFFFCMHYINAIHIWTSTDHIHLAVEPAVKMISMKISTEHFRKNLDENDIVSITIGSESTLYRFAIENSDSLTLHDTPAKHHTNWLQIRCTLVVCNQLLHRIFIYYTGNYIDDNSPGVDRLIIRAVFQEQNVFSFITIQITNNTDGNTKTIASHGGKWKNMYSPWNKGPTLFNNFTVWTSSLSLYLDAVPSAWLFSMNVYSDTIPETDVVIISIRFMLALYWLTIEQPDGLILDGAGDTQHDYYLKVRCSLVNCQKCLSRIFIYHRPQTIFLHPTGKDELVITTIYKDQEIVSRIGVQLFNESDEIKRWTRNNTVSYEINQDTFRTPSFKTHALWILICVVLILSFRLVTEIVNLYKNPSGYSSLP
jgi:hypothetical protein